MGQHISLPSGIGAYRAAPDGAPRGGIVVIQEIFGVNAHIRDVADRFAAHGYLAIAPAFFDHVERGIELDYDEAGVARGRELVTQIGLDAPLEDIRAAAVAIAGAGRVGTVGFCWGGTLALRAAQELGLPSVSYYGGRNAQYLDREPQAPVMFHFGERDRHIGADVVQKHREALPNMNVFTYPADHGFNCDRRSSYDAASAELAMERTLAFFDHHLAPS